jgi:DNA polymerase III delta prime subunit
VLLHQQTEKRIHAFLENPAHALIITGSLGSGKLHIALHIASKLLNKVDQNSLISYPYFQIIEPEKQSISIAQIRQIRKFLQLKTTGKNSCNRVVIIDQSHFMNSEAQNALLKILEEPPDDTVIILTVQGEKSLKDTIYSRGQQIAVVRPTKENTLKYFLDKGQSSQDVLKAYALSNGAVGLMHALLNENEATSEISSNIDTAKLILTESAYQRMLRVDTLSKSPENLPSLLYSLRRVCRAALENAANKKNGRDIHNWYTRLKIIHTTELSLKSNPNTKLLLSHLFVHL